MHILYILYIYNKTPNWGGLCGMVFYNIFFYLPPPHKYLDQFSLLYVFSPKPSTKENIICVTDFLVAAGSHANTHPGGICSARVTHISLLDIRGALDHSSLQTKLLKCSISALWDGTAWSTWESLQFLKEHWEETTSSKQQESASYLPAPTMRMLSFLFKTLPAGFSKSPSYSPLGESPCSSYHYLIFNSVHTIWGVMKLLDMYSSIFGRDMPSVFSHCQCSFWVGNTAEEILYQSQLSSVDSFK